MLEEHYSAKFRELVSSTNWEIELPVEWIGYFDHRGEMASYCDDQRNNQRLKIRAHGLLGFERDLPFRPRTNEPVGIYTRDFAKNGVGFLAPLEIYPEERVRILLPTFWVQLEVVRARRITSKCYELGARLRRRRDPSLDAFDFGRLATPVGT